MVYAVDALSLNRLHRCVAWPVTAGVWRCTPSMNKCRPDAHQFVSSPPAASLHDRSAQKPVTATANRQRHQPIQFLTLTTHFNIILISTNRSKWRSASGFPSNMLYVFLINVMRATCPTHHIIIQITLSKRQNIHSSWRCHFSVILSFPPFGSEFHPFLPKSSLFSNSLCSAARGVQPKAARVTFHLWYCLNETATSYCKNLFCVRALLCRIFVPSKAGNAACRNS